jgi:PAS domain S-box-containing protein
LADVAAIAYAAAAEFNLRGGGVVEQVLRRVRAQNTRYALVVLSLLLVPAMAASVFRALAIGWQPVQVLHLAGAVVIWGTLPLRHQLSQAVLAGVVLSVLAVVGAFGALQFGLSAGAMPLLLMLPVLAQLFYNSALALVLLALVTALLASAALLALNDALPLVMEPAAYLHSAEHWLLYLSANAMMAGTVLAMIHGYLRGIREQVAALRREQRLSDERSEQLQQQMRDAEASLAEARWYLDASIAVGQRAHWRYTPGREAMWWSPASYALLGLQPGMVEPTLARLLGALRSECAQRISELLGELERAPHGTTRSLHCRTFAAGGEVLLLHIVMQVQLGGEADRRIFGCIEDQTVAQRTESTLRAESARLGQMLDSLQLGTWDWHVPSGKTVFNERWAQIIGYTLAELEPTTIDTWMSQGHPEDLKASSRQLERHFSGAIDHYDCEARMRHRDGHWVWVRDRGQVVERDGEGAPLRVMGTHEDISARKQREFEYEEQAYMLQEIGRIAGIGGWSYREEEGRLYWSSETRRLHEVPDDFEPDLATAIDFYHPDDRRAIALAVEEGLSHGTPWDLQLRLITYRGRLVHVRAMGEVTHREPGAVRMVGTFSASVSEHVPESPESRE